MSHKSNMSQYFNTNIAGLVGIQCNKLGKIQRIVLVLVTSNDEGLDPVSGKT